MEANMKFDISTIIWIFFILAALQPLLQKRLLEMAQILTEGRWTHDYPVTFEEAAKLGLHVNKGIPAELYQLMSLFPQPVKQQPSLEYIAVPKFRRPA
jgi:ClpP class serine protease